MGGEIGEIELRWLPALLLTLNEALQFQRSSLSDLDALHQAKALLVEPEWLHKSDK